MYLSRSHNLFGVCRYYFRGPGLVEPHALIGTAAAVHVALLEMLNDLANVDPNLRADGSCNAIQLLSRSIWYKGVAERVPVTIAAVGYAPIVNLAAHDSTLASVVAGKVMNRQGRLASIILAGDRCLCCPSLSAPAAGVGPALQICPVAVATLLNRL
jgi:hypothetical protein